MGFILWKVEGRTQFESCFEEGRKSHVFSVGGWGLKASGTLSPHCYYVVYIYGVEKAADYCKETGTLSPRQMEILCSCARL